MASDHFSRQAASYRLFRPTYPPAFLGWVASLPTETQVLWDVGTGNGQAAVGLAPWFRRVIATDLSFAQVTRAEPHSGVTYGLAVAENAPLAPGRVNAVTVAQALHWFDFPRFWSEVRRVLCPGGVIVAWCYERATIAPGIDPVLERFHDGTVGRYWPARREYVRRGYRDIPFPFERIPAPAEALTVRWDLDHLLGYVGSWSAVDRYRQATGTDPIPALDDELAALWGLRTEAREVRWPLSILAGRT